MRFKEIFNPLPRQGTQYFYRIVDKQEWMNALSTGFLMPSEFYKRIHASYEPEYQYGKRGDIVLQIKYDSADEWFEKQGDKVYLVTYNKVSIDKITPIKQIGSDTIHILNFTENNSPVDKVNGDLRYQSGWVQELSEVFPKILPAKYTSLKDDSGIVVSSINYNDDNWFAYRTNSGFDYTQDFRGVLSDIKNQTDSISIFGKFMRNSGALSYNS